MSRPATTSPAALSVEKVVAGYGGVVALQDVSITARPATITAVLGANGAGKTTLDRKSTRLNSSHERRSRMPSSA